MRQVTGLTSTYSSDEFGICSALYELGGMVVMHDASGCNSTYTTHDEPRWYDRDSMIFISAISEAEAIMGDDDKLVSDLVETANGLQPRFIALVGAPIPYMMGTDLDAIARLVEEETGIRSFAFPANGMHDYTRGVSMALERIVREFAGKEDALEENESRTVFEDRRKGQGEIGVNLLGVTPLDFYLDGSIERIKTLLGQQGLVTKVCLSVDCSLDEVERLPEAKVNLVLSVGGLAAAQALKAAFGCPYVVGVPLDEGGASRLSVQVRRMAMPAKEPGQNCAMPEKEPGQDCAMPEKELGQNCAMPAKEIRQIHTMLARETTEDHKIRLAIVGEPVHSLSLAELLEREYAVETRVLCPLELGGELLRRGDVMTPEEDDLLREFAWADGVIADPLYQPLVGEKAFYPLPHPAFSGRMYASREIGEWKACGSEYL